MLPDAALFSMKVMFATPCHISAVSMNYTVGIFDLVMHTKRFGPECILHMHSESLITRARNKMVLRFLEDERSPTCSGSTRTPASPRSKSAGSCSPIATSRRESIR
jgi:hypothetical protein